MNQFDTRQVRRTLVSGPLLGTGVSTPNGSTGRSEFGVCGNRDSGPSIGPGFRLCGVGSVLRPQTRPSIRSPDPKPDPQPRAPIDRPIGGVDSVSKPSTRDPDPQPSKVQTPIDRPIQTLNPQRSRPSIRGPNPKQDP